jgi:hypothetical protein
MVFAARRWELPAGCGERFSKMDFGGMVWAGYFRHVAGLNRIDGWMAAGVWFLLWGEPGLRCGLGCWTGGEVNLCGVALGDGDPGGMR